MYRLLRAAAAIELLAVDADGRYRLTALSSGLRGDDPNTVRDLVLLNASDLDTLPWSALSDSVRTGLSPFERIFGADFFDHLRCRSQAADVFDRAMTQMSISSAAAYLAQYDFTGLRRVADIGGGRGYFLATLLQRYEQMVGVLVDRPTVVLRAVSLMRQYGVDDRAAVVAGDFFREVPTRCDAYILKNVLHDWDDADATQILTTVRRAAGRSAFVLICEHVLGPPGSRDYGAMLDLDMMLKHGGRERDLESWQQLITGAGLRLTNTPAAGCRTVLECRSD